MRQIMSILGLISVLPFMTFAQPSGKPESVQPTIGIYFTDQPATKFPVLLQLENDRALDIPAGQKDFLVTDRFTLPEDIQLLAIYPHAHYLCRDMLVLARFADGSEIEAEARERGLVQFGENVREQVSFICNCCGCCCEAMIAARRFSFMKPVHTTNYQPDLEASRCQGCGKCVNACPVEALSLVSAHDPRHPAAKRAQLDEDRCLGCGVCVRACRRAAIRLKVRRARVLTPANTAHRTVVMALERGQLAELLVDGLSGHGHRAVAAILGAVLKLPPLKQALASRQLKSRYLDRLMAGM